jgi:hypothetical protein
MRFLFLAFFLASAVSAAPKKKPKTQTKVMKKTGPSQENNTPAAPQASTPDPGTSAAPPSRGPTRIDFDDRLIQGQTNKSGSVYLYDRKELNVRSMIKKRDNFRDEIVSSLDEGTKDL